MNRHILPGLLLAAAFAGVIFAVGVVQGFPKGDWFTGQQAHLSKELTNAIGAKAMTDYTQFIPSMLTAQAARLASRALVTTPPSRASSPRYARA